MDVERSASSEDAEDLDPTEVMGDLADLLRCIGSVWLAASEDELTVYFWHQLFQAGKVPNSTRIEHIECVATLLAINRMKSHFYSYAFEEGTVAEYEYPVWELIGDYPKAEPYWLGVYAGTRWDADEELDVAPFGSWESEALKTLAEEVYSRTASALISSLGESEVFAALWTSRQSDSTFPVPDDVALEVLNSDPWAKMAAWSWVTDGMPAGGS